MTRIPNSTQHQQEGWSPRQELRGNEEAKSKEIVYQHHIPILGTPHTTMQVLTTLHAWVSFLDFN